MNYSKPGYAGPVLAPRRPPLLFSSALIVVFFLNYHDLSYATRGVGNYNLSPDDLIAGVVEGSPVRRISLLLLGMVAVISLLHHRAKVRLHIRSATGWLLVGFVAWAFSSSLWSDDLALTTRRLIAFGILCVVAVAFAQRFSLRQTILWVFFTNAIFAIVSLLAEAQAQTFEPLAAGYRFAGSMHPNGQGIECGLLFLSAIASAELYKRWRVSFFSAAFLAFVFLVLTGSRTALFATLLATVVYVAAVSSRRTKSAITLGATLISCFLLLFLGAGLAPGLKSAALLGREDPGSVDSFSGRTMIWTDVEQYIRQRPILGYGYGAFWTPTRTGLISDEEKQGVPNSHSAYIDYLLTLGAVGLVAYASLLVCGIWRAFHFHRLSRNSTFAFCGAFLVFCAVEGLLESAIGEGSLLMFLFLAVLARLAFVPSELRSPTNFLYSAAPPIPITMQEQYDHA